jgi:signal peptidase I
MRSSAGLTVALRVPARHAAIEYANKAAGIGLVVLVCLLWMQYLRPQSLGGNAGYVLVSGQSMEPRYHTGDMVLVEKQASYHPGQVIAYRVPKGDPMAGAQVIHRIIGGDAKHGFIVRGDNRTAPDVWRPRARDIVGAKALRIPNAIVVLQYLRAPMFLALLAAAFVFVHVLAGGPKAPEPRTGDQDEREPLRPAA